MAKWLLTLIVFLTSVNGHAFQSAEVYRWVDENGNVYFSDMPRDKNAKLVAIKPGITAKADTATLPELTQVNDDAALAETGSEMMEAPNSAEACRDLKVEMNKRMRDLNGTSPEAQRLARVFIAEAEKTLKESGCI